MIRTFATGLAMAMAFLTAPAGAQPSQVEEIYIARSLRLSRVAPTDFCATRRSGFKSTSEDRYEFHTTTLRTSDGRMVDTFGKTIGSGHGCFGATGDSLVTNFYLELQLGSIAVKGNGDCRRTKTDFPEKGLNPMRCFLLLSDPTGRYAGGQLTTNTMWSRQLMGPRSDPPGYAQPSIATIRLWKKTATKE